MGPHDHIITDIPSVVVHHMLVKQYISDKRVADGFATSVTKLQLYDALCHDILDRLRERIEQVSAESATPFRIVTSDIDRMGSELFTDIQRYATASCHLYSGSVEAMRQYAETRARDSRTG